MTDREIAGCERKASIVHSGFGPMVLRGLNPRACQGSTALKNHVALTQGAQRSAGIARMHAATGNREKQVQFALLGDA